MANSRDDVPLEHPDEPFTRDEIEERFISQEHRLSHLVGNLIEYGLPGSTSKFRRAARLAVVWRLLTGAAVLGAVGGLISWLTLWEISKQTEQLRLQTAEVQKQTLAFAEQNDAIIEQNRQFAAQQQHTETAEAEARRALCLSLIYDRYQPSTGEESGELRASVRARTEAARSLLRLESARANTTSEPTPVDLSHAELPGLSLYKIAPAPYDADGLTHNLEPECDSDLSNLLISFYRGSLREATFGPCLLKKTVFAWTDLTGSSFEGTRIDNCDFSNATLSDVGFYGADLSSSYITNLKSAESAEDAEDAALHVARSLVEDCHFYLDYGLEYRSERSDYKKVAISGAKESNVLLSQIGASQGTITSGQGGHIEIEHSKLDEMWIVQGAGATASLWDCDLRDVVFWEQMYPAGTKVNPAKRRVHLDRCNLIDCDLREIDATSLTVRNCHYNSSTQWPSGYTPPPSVGVIRPTRTQFRTW